VESFAMHQVMPLRYSAAVSLFVVSSLAAFAQAAPPPSCPVVVTSATFTRHAPLPVPDPNATTADKSYGTLEFHYRNQSGEPIRSFTVSARFLPPSAVQPPLLKTPENVERYLQGSPLAADDSSSAHYEVQSQVKSLLWLRLDKVVYQDGSSWTPPPSAPPGQCTYRPEAKVIPAHPVPTSTTVK
jgi:hypothetical protein